MPFFRRVTDNVYETDDIVVDLIEVARRCGPALVEPIWDKCLPFTWIGMAGDSHAYVNYVGSLN